MANRFIVEHFPDGEVEAPIVLLDNGDANIIAVGVMNVDDGEFEVTFGITKEIAEKLGIEVRFEWVTSRVTPPRGAIFLQRKTEDSEFRIKGL